MLSFHCRRHLFLRMERFALQRNIDRTSVLKLALHYHLNRLASQRGIPSCSSSVQQAPPCHETSATPEAPAIPEASTTSDTL